MPPAARKKPADGLEDEEDLKRQSEKSATAKWVEGFLDGKFCTVFMVLMTVAALWGDDVRLAYTEKSFDIIMYVLNVVMLLSFTAEFFAATIVKEGYKWGFFFWLDGVAALSLVTEVPFIVSFLQAMLRMRTSDDGTPTTQQASDGGDAAQAGRFARLVRLVRLIRIVKIYSMLSKASEAREEEERKAAARAASNAKQAALKRVEASRLGKVLSEMTTRRVIIGLLLMLLVLPFLLPPVTDNSLSFGLRLLFNYGTSGCAVFQGRQTDYAARMRGSFLGPADGLALYPCTHQEPWIADSAWQSIVVLYSNINPQQGGLGAVMVKRKLLYLRTADPRAPHRGKVADIDRVVTTVGEWAPEENCTGLSLSPDCPYREEEVEDILFLPWECLPTNPAQNPCEGTVSIARFDKKAEVQVTATYSCYRTLFVCLLLGLLNYQFQRDTHSLVILPIEKMVNIIKQLAVDPLSRPTPQPDVGEEEEDYHLPKHKKKKKAPQLETAMLEETVMKIAELVQIGFGSSGKHIIGKNINTGDGELSIMIPGEMCEGLFGYVDIRDFGAISDALKEQVTLFLNTVAEILYGCVDRWKGVPTKNYGDAFLFIWIQDRPDGPEQKDIQMKGDSTLTTAQTDMALLSFIKILAEVKRHSGTRKFREYQRQLMGYEAFRDGFELRLGLALHKGWAVESVIGSTYKIEATYISPHVPLIMAVDQATKAYRVPLVLTEKFYMSMSLPAKEKVRRLDTVRIGQSLFGLYTFDVDLDGVARGGPAVQEGHKLAQLVCPEELAKALGREEVMLETLETQAVEHLFSIDQDVAALQQGVPKNLAFDYREAVCYVGEGDWERARPLFVRILEYWPDGPSRFHLQCIEKYGPKTPEDWGGYHTIDTATLNYFIFEAPEPSMDVPEPEAPPAGPAYMSSEPNIKRGYTSAQGSKKSSVNHGSQEGDKVSDKDRFADPAAYAALALTAADMAPEPPLPGSAEDDPETTNMDSEEQPEVPESRGPTPAVDEDPGAEADPPRDTPDVI